MWSFFVTPFRGLVDGWRKEGSTRRSRTPTDPAAEALESCARDVDKLLADVERDSQTITPAQYAKLHHVTPQTVTKWIRDGELIAERTPSGYRISRAAVRLINTSKGSKRRKD